MQTKQTQTPKQPKKQWVKPEMTVVVIEAGTAKIADGTGFAS